MTQNCFLGPEYYTDAEYVEMKEIQSSSTRKDKNDDTNAFK